MIKYLKINLIAALLSIGPAPGLSAKEYNILAYGATLFGSTRLADYPENLPDYTFYRKGTVKRALIYAEKCSNQ